MKKLGQMIAWIIILGAITYDNFLIKIEEIKEIKNYKKKIK